MFVGLPQELFPKCLLIVFLLFLALICLGLCARSPWIKPAVTSFGKLRNGSRVSQIVSLLETLTILRVSLPPSEGPWAAITEDSPNASSLSLVNPRKH